MKQVGTFQVLIFQTTTLNTADVPGISQFPVGTSSKSAFSTLNWIQFPVEFEEPVLLSQTLLHIIDVNN